MLLIEKYFIGRIAIQLKFIPIAGCPGCKGSQHTLLFPIENSKVYRCNACQLKFLNPCLDPESMIQAYESSDSLRAIHAHHEGYYEYGNLHSSSQTKKEFSHALSKLEKLISPKLNETIFDVGYGNGFFLAIAKSRGWSIDGIDSSVQNQKKASELFSIQLKTGSFYDFHHSGERFDVVAFWDVIEHLPNPDIFLAKAKSLLRPDGYLLIGVPNDKSLMALMAYFLYKVTFGRFSFAVKKLYFLEHVSYFRLNSLKQLMQSNGFYLKDHFYSSTDLKKYRLPFSEKVLSYFLLVTGRLLGLQNRLISIYSLKP